MALTLKENFLLHKIHSLTGIVPVGYYVAQHLVLNTFALGGPEKFDGIINFFDSMPWYFLLIMEVCAIWGPLAFHAIYGLAIVGRAENNYSNPKYKFTQNRMFVFQRYTGIFLVLFLCIHVSTTTGRKYFGGDSHLVKYDAMQQMFHSLGGAPILLYALGVAAASYHLGLGVWNFCIRWGITVSEEAQIKMQKVGIGIAVALTLVGWAALAGFLLHTPTAAPAAAQAVSHVLHG